LVLWGVPGSGSSPDDDADCAGPGRRGLDAAIRRSRSRRHHQRAPAALGAHERDAVADRGQPQGRRRSHVREGPRPRPLPAGERLGRDPARRDRVLAPDAAAPLAPDGGTRGDAMSPWRCILSVALVLSGGTLARAGVVEGAVTIDGHVGTGAVIYL